MQPRDTIIKCPAGDHNHAVVDGNSESTFQIVTCPSCKKTFRDTFQTFIRWGRVADERD